MTSTIGRKSYARITEEYKLPTLIEVQLESFEWFKKDGLAQLFDEITPVESFNKGMKLFFPSRTPESKEFKLQYWFEDPKYGPDECLDRDMTYAAPLYVKVLLAGTEVPEPIVSDIFLGDFPLMTEKGTFIINGTERVVVSQLIRSPGVYFEATDERATGRRLASAKLIPDRGAWMEFETRKSDYITVKFNRKRTVPVTMLLRALAAVDDALGGELPYAKGVNEEMLSLFAEVDTNPDHQFIATTLRQEPTWEMKEKRPIAQEAMVEFYKRMRPGDPPTLDNAKEYLEQQLFDQRRYDLERVGRYKLNQKLGLSEKIPLTHRTITKHDLIALITRMIQINNGQENPDDIDHLGNRRVKTVGELIQAKLRIGLRRTERIIKERMSIREQGVLSPVTLINIRPVVAAIREFFGSSQLSQFMDQTNPLAELRHKRTLSALGPGGLRRERAGFDVRDVHHSHYGRICPIETPEGPNIGLIGRLASYAKVNPFGFIETPYRKIYKTLPANDKRLVGRHLRDDVTHPKSGEVLGKKGEEITKEMAKHIARLGETEIALVPFVSDDVMYLSADAEDRYIVAQANAPLNEFSEFIRVRASCRHHSKFIFAAPEQIDYMDIAPCQIVGISAALIPFLEHDDANRALMGSNMQAQAVPLLQPEVATVSTGMESHAAIDSGQVVQAEEDGEVVSVTGKEIVVLSGNKKKTYRLRKYQRSNQSTCIDQHPVVTKGQRVKKGHVIADSSSTDHGEIALGQNVLVAFMSWEGGNFEDAILISERLVREDKFTSVHIEKHEVEARDTKLGPEEITYDIPNVGEDALKDLDEHGIVRIGADVGPNDILVGKITPKGEKELSPEEKLLRAIFGEKAREVKDSSLRLPHGEKGKVVDVRVFTRDEHRDLPAGVEKMVRVSVAQRRKLTEGDKMAGRHGNKGVVSQIVPVEDMPFLEDGTPVDIILNPLGVPGRMNIGQILETHLGWAADRLGFRAVTPVFDGANEMEIEAELARAWLIDRAWKEATEMAWDWLLDQEIDPDSVESEEEARLLYLQSWLGKGKKYDPELLATDFAYARRAALTEWLREKGYDPEATLLFDDSELKGGPRAEADQNAIDACLRIWLGDHGSKVEKLSGEALRKKANDVTLYTGAPLPVLGRMRVFDGKSGEPYDNAVTVGIIHMLKLAHLVEDKVHARSTGPYSLVTQQPLGGKAQFGGQRFGEMEVWALEAYGAAYTLQEMLTVKSDDVQGRVKTYESIVKGEEIEEPGIPASFRVLVKELQSLGLAVEAVTDTGETIKFGKDEEKQRTPRLGKTGLTGLIEE
ncbi:MAG: DNA-directed RNA polymerase subunit beta [Chloroflexi bacterium]|nr:DNA-directed RNA polymerase subunit beta [Chloroflexota bacterium]